MNTNPVALSAGTGPAQGSGRRILAIYAVTFLVVSLPFSIIHLTAHPDDAALNPLQRMAASVANFSGPWGVLLVRLVNFPNAGLRSFSWPLAMGLTLLGGVLMAVPLLFRVRALQILGAVAWALFAIAWFAVGLSQIASGLL